MTIVRRAWIGDLEITDYPYGLEFGADLGSPEGEIVTFESLLADGQVESLLRRLNRGMTLPLVVCGQDLGEVLAHEAALVTECDRRMNTLTLDLGDGYAEPMVFETTVIDPKRITGAGSDEADMASMHRWSVEVKAQPFWRSTTKIIDDAGTPPSSGGTLFYNCESTTGWASSSGDPSVAANAEYVVDSAIFTEGAGSIRSRTQSYDNWTPGESHSLGYDKISGLSLSTDTGGYLSICVRFQWTMTAFQIFVTTASGGRQQVMGPVAAEVDVAGFVHYVWPVDAGLTVTALDFLWRQTGPVIGSIATNPHYVWYDDFELLPAATTDHQIVKTLDVKGSARTSGSLRVSAPSETVALGQVLAVTVPTDEIKPGFQPDGRRWVAQGTTTVDAAALHGSYFTPDTAAYSTAAGKPIFDLPVNMLTAGPYTMVALVKAESASLTFGVQARLRLGTSDVGPTSAAEVSPTGLTTGWQLMSVGTVYLPPLPMQGADDATSKVRLLFKGAKFSDVFFIPAWEVGGRPVADFSIVDCGTGTVGAGLASSSLWIDSPAIENDGLGAWWRGPTTDRLNAQSAWPDAKKPGVHVFRPGSLTAFLVSTGAAGPTLALEYFDRYL